MGKQQKTIDTLDKDLKDYKEKFQKAVEGKSKS